MKFDFDEVIDRKKTMSVKYDFPDRFGKMGYNYIPLWIADMDFRSPPCVREELAERLDHGIFGYSSADYSYFEAVGEWMSKRHDWHVEQEWLIRTQGVVNALSVIFHAITKTGDAILIQTPSYNMFNTMIEKNARRTIKNPLILENGKYEIDFEDFEKQIKRNDVKLFVLCNPYNPVGRVWTKEELVKMGDICLQYGVTVIADEVHEDFVYKPHKHLVFANLKHEYESIAITCTSPAKTFNLAGLPISNIFISNEDIYEKVADEIFARGNLGSGIMELAACRAAYAGGAEWLDALLEYLADNVRFVREFLSERIPEITLIEPEGTYLVWLDFRELGFWAKELDAFLSDEAKVLLGGAPGGEGFQRINIACPRSTLEKAFAQMETAIRKARRQ
jgi:cystathionine beta-lyase